MTMQQELAALFRRDLTRVIQELEAFPKEEELWSVAPGISNSAGNLVLHLEGNLREYVGRQLGGIAYERRRPEEFSGKGVGVRELVERMEQVRRMVYDVTSTLSSATMEAAYPENALGSVLPTRQFLIHLHGHLNFHLGQIDYLRRFLTGSGAVSFAGL